MSSALSSWARTRTCQSTYHQQCAVYGPNLPNALAGVTLLFTMSQFPFLEVPSEGPLIRDGVYQRSQLHGRFAGNHQAGIVPSTTEPVVLIFHTLEPANQFYSDGLDEHGVYRYSGQGMNGDMKWNAQNLAIRDHAANEREILFFERFERAGGHWQFRYKMLCIGVDTEKRPGKNGILRDAFIFKLIDQDVQEQQISPSLSDLPLASLRQLAIEASSQTPGSQSRASTAFSRSAPVRAYALKRSGGKCEACRNPAPFLKVSGDPFLEVHHIQRVSDGGPDHPAHVAAICPNCHRRCHSGSDGTTYNAMIAQYIHQLEQSLG